MSTTIWFSSDPHFHHENILKYGERPFANLTEMHDAIITLHNERVKPSDHWYCLGDVTMERDGQGRGLEILSKMNGHKRLILGNHDHYKMKHYLSWFEKVMAMQMLENIRFTHIPIHPSSLGRSLGNVHGHIHQNKDYPPHHYIGKDGRVVVQPYMNICLEVTEYKPLTLEEVITRVKRTTTEYAGVKVGDEAYRRDEE